MISGMERVAIITSVICCFCCHTASAFLTVTPRNTESKVNDSTYFNCSTDITSKEIHWSHGSSYVFAGGSFYDPYLGFRIEGNKTTGVYNLIIPSVEPQFAGEYSCQDDGGHGMMSSAQLIVLDNDPTCYSNVIQDGSNSGIDPDKVLLLCIVTYHGNILPQLEWHKAGENASMTNSTIVQSCNSATCSIKLKTDVSMNNQWFVCQTTHSATSQYKCNSETIILQYVLSGNATVNITMGKKVQCIANSSQTCSYKWIWYSESDSLTVSTDQTLNPTRPGSHRCEATCSVGNKSSTVDVMFVEVSATEEATPTEQKSSFLFFVLPIVLILLIIITIIVVVCCRKKCKKPDKRSSNEYEINIPHDSETTYTALPVQNKKQVMQNRADPNKDEQSAMVALVGENTEDDKLLKQGGDITGLRFFEGNPVLVSHIKRGENEEKYITGLIVLRDMLIVATSNEAAVKAYNVTTFELVLRVPISGLERLYDIAGCRLTDSVFICGSEPKPEENVILKLDPTLAVNEKWSTGDNFGNLSMSGESNVILCVSYKNMLIEYKSNGEKIREIILPDLVYPTHAIKLTCGQFVVSHGHKKEDTLHRVCIVDENGKVMKSFRGETGTSLEQLSNPSYLIVDEAEGFILVVDGGNNRALLLDTNLRLKMNLFPKRAVLENPSKMCFCKATLNLCVLSTKEVLIFAFK